MRAIEVFKFSWRLVRVKLVRSLFIFAALFLATLVVTLFLALCAGLRHYILEPAAANLEADLIIATPKSSHSDRALSLFDYFRGTARAGIAPEVVAQVKAWPEVSKVGVETRVPFPVATRAEIVFGVPLEFDTTVSGFSETVARPFLPSGQSFSGAEEVVPVLLSPLLIEIYNSTLAEIIPGIAKKTKDDFLEKPIEFTFGRINYLTALASFPPGLFRN